MVVLQKVACMLFLLSLDSWFLADCVRELRKMPSTHRHDVPSSPGSVSPIWKSFQSLLITIGGIAGIVQAHTSAL